MSDEYFEHTTSDGVSIIYGADPYKAHATYPSTPTESYRFEILDFDQEIIKPRSTNFFKKMK